MQPLFAAVADGLRDRLTPSKLAALEKAMRAAVRRRDDHRSIDLKSGLEARLRSLEGEIAAGANRVLEVPKSLLGEVSKALEQKTAERDRLASELAAINVSTSRPVDAIGRLLEALRDVRRVLAGADPATANAILRAAGVTVRTKPASVRPRRPAQPAKLAARRSQRAARPSLSAVVTLGNLSPSSFNEEQVPRNAGLSFEVTFAA
jgi:hypothetical protein